MLRCALEKFAKRYKRNSGMSQAEMLAGTIELYEHGFITIEPADDGVVVRLSTPEEINGL